jgi:hypothetical protein
LGLETQELFFLLILPKNSAGGAEGCYLAAILLLRAALRAALRAGAVWAQLAGGAEGCYLAAAGRHLSQRNQERSRVGTWFLRPPALILHPAAFPILRPSSRLSSYTAPNRLRPDLQLPWAAVLSGPAGSQALTLNSSLVSPRTQLSSSHPAKGADAEGLERCSPACAQHLRPSPASSRPPPRPAAALLVSLLN